MNRIAIINEAFNHLGTEHGRIQMGIDTLSADEIDRRDISKTPDGTDAVIWVDEQEEALARKSNRAYVITLHRPDLPHWTRSTDVIIAASAITELTEVLVPQLGLRIKFNEEKDKWNIKWSLNAVEEVEAFLKGVCSNSGATLAESVSLNYYPWHFYEYKIVGKGWVFEWITPEAEAQAKINGGMFLIVFDCYVLMAADLKSLLKHVEKLNRVF